MADLISTEDTIAEIKLILKDIQPDLNTTIQHGFNVFHCANFIENSFQIDRIEWVKCPNKHAQKYLIRERLLDSLIQTHKQLRIEIERIMYGH